VPRQDANRKYLQRRLGEVASLQEFPAFTYPKLLQRGKTIDVTWFNARDFPYAYFEVEHSTDIQNSLLKFVEFQDFCVRFFVVADEKRKREFEDKVHRTAFSDIVQRVEFLDYERLTGWYSREAALAATKVL
jgi:hypothetical protein